MDTLLTIPQIRERYFPATSARWIREHLIVGRRVESVKLGKTHYVPQASVEAYIERIRRHAINNRW